MSIQKQELYKVIESLPEELSSKVIYYIEYLKKVHYVKTAINICNTFKALQMTNNLLKKDQLYCKMPSILT